MTRHFCAGLSTHTSAPRVAHTNLWGRIKAFVMVVSKQERIELTVRYSAADKEEIITLTRRNWRTGEETTLYNGFFTGGKPKKKRLPRD